MDLGLKGLRALVAASSDGLGYATALELAREGALVAINSRSMDKLEAAAARIEGETGARVAAFPADLSDPDIPAELVDNATAALGGLDILVTNSGGPPSGRFDDLSENNWQHSLELVFHSHRRLIHAALPHLRASKHASVLTITSISVKQPIPNLAPSNAGRQATIGLTKTLALELGPEGIRFNSILPGYTETERITKLMEKRAADKGTSLAEELAAANADSPLGRMGRPDEFAKVAAFLVSPAASYITGVMLSVDGGLYKGTV
jgi:3-oxoacyl-[acyl-carrier protein] reductase